jgi:hypothetical protein
MSKSHRLVRLTGKAAEWGDTGHVPAATGYGVELPRRTDNPLVSSRAASVRRGDGEDTGGGDDGQDAPDGEDDEWDEERGGGFGGGSAAAHVDDEFDLEVVQRGFGCCGHALQVDLSSCDGRLPQAVISELKRSNEHARETGLQCQGQCYAITLLLVGGVAIPVVGVIGIVGLLR